MNLAKLKASSATVIAAISVLALSVHLALRLGLDASSTWGRVAIRDIPLLIALIACGAPLVFNLFMRLLRFEFSSDLLAGLSILAAVILGEYLAGTIVVLMLSGGQVLEEYAVRRASSVLHALAKRTPKVAHYKQSGGWNDIDVGDVKIGDLVVVFPHEICPVDGAVVEGHGSMDESYLTGEPFVLSKAPGSTVLSGAINQDSALTIRVEKKAEDSRYSKILQIMRESEQSRPQLRRLGDRLGAFYTPTAITIACAAWLMSGDATRFLAVLVVATPCPLLIAIPVAILGGISLAARKGIIIKDSTILEKLDSVRTAIFDKTGTLSYGKPKLTQITTAAGFIENDVLELVASLERYSRHPLSSAIVEAAQARNVSLFEAVEVSETPGCGLHGTVQGKKIQVTSRNKVIAQHPEFERKIPEPLAGMECVILIDSSFAATFRFRDEPRLDSRPFIRHLPKYHGVERVILASGDRSAEVNVLAEKVGIKEVHSGMSPEEKVALVKRESQLANTLFLGDGINDAPALMSATVGIAFGGGSDITMEAAGAVILESSLEKFDELLHIGRRMRSIALQSAIGGMALSLICVGFAFFGALPPVAGAIAQEVVDVLAVLNALRAGLPPKVLTDFQ